MNNNELKTEVLLVSKYCMIIKQILTEHKQLSLNKLLFFSYLLKNNNNYLGSLYNAKTTNDIVIKAISQISGKFEDYCSNIKYIIEAIHILIKNNDVILRDTFLFINDGCETDNKYKNRFIDNAIIESGNYSDRQFLKEVLNNV